MTVLTVSLISNSCLWICSSIPSSTIKLSWKAKSAEIDLILDIGPNIDTNQDEVNQFPSELPRQGPSENFDKRSAANFQINIDKQKIAQVVRNLLSNALKFTPKGGRITIKATVILVAAVDRYTEVRRSATSLGPSSDCSLSPPYFRFEVTDTGPGISAVSLISLLMLQFTNSGQSSNSTFKLPLINFFL